MKRLLVPAAVVFAFFVIGNGFSLRSRLAPPPSSLPPATGTEPPAESIPPLYEYVEVTDGCGPYFAGACVNMRSGPGTEYPVVLRLRTGMVLRVGEAVRDAGGQLWYGIDPGANIRYPERITTGWYISSDVVTEFEAPGDRQLGAGAPAASAKRITIDRSENMLYAYDGDGLFMRQPISVGLEGTPTPRGTFALYAMTPSRYMQGPIPGISDETYDLPGVPWNLYFTQEGAVIHGAYWHDRFGEPWSHGCVNLPPEKAKELYEWADLGIPITVQD